MSTFLNKNENKKKIRNVEHVGLKMKYLLKLPY